VPASSVPAIDVLIPAFNAADTVRASVRSIQDQTVRDLRIIVVDDGSTDGTGATLREIAAADPRVEVIATDNGGIVAALNLALARATAPLIARHDADDIAFPDRLARQLAYLDAHPDCVALGAEAYLVDGEGRRFGRTRFAGPAEGDPASLPAREPYLMHPFLLARAAVLRAAGGYRHVLHAEDVDLYWRLLAHGRLHNLPDLLGEYRIHEGSVSSVSPHRGRLASAYAELAALSFRRQAAGLPDIDFPADARARMERPAGIAAVVDALSAPLGTDERAHFRLAVAAKLLRNASYRPYLLEPEDCRFIAGARPELERRADAAGRGALRREQGAVLLKLLRARRGAAIRALAAPPLVWARLAPWVAWRGAQRLRLRRSGRD
jgi:GT2 family glycosyltransferase